MRYLIPHEEIQKTDETRNWGVYHAGWNRYLSEKLYRQQYTHIFYGIRYLRRIPYGKESLLARLRVRSLAYAIHTRQEAASSPLFEWFLVQCHVCGARKGQFHDSTCEEEKCPRCHKRRKKCRCLLSS